MKKDWKLKLRYGKTKTSFKHYTVLANGIVRDLSSDKLYGYDVNFTPYST